MVILPDFGNDWLTETPGTYIIIALDLSDDNITMFWGDGGCSYTDSLVSAGLFSEAVIKYLFEKGVQQAAPIPCTRQAFLLLGLYPITAKYEYLDQFKPISFSQTTRKGL